MHILMSAVQFASLLVALLYTPRLLFSIVNGQKIPDTLPAIWGTCMALFVATTWLWQ